MLVLQQPITMLLEATAQVQTGQLLRRSAFGVHWELVLVTKSQRILRNC